MIALIESNGEVSLERPSIDAVHVVRRALVDPRVHLSGGIDLDFRLYFVRTDLPLVYLLQKMRYINESGCIARCTAVYSLGKFLCADIFVILLIERLS